MIRIFWNDCKKDNLTSYNQLKKQFQNVLLANVIAKLITSPPQIRKNV